MKNKNNELHSGFTIAELLLSMLIVMVVAAAMVPIIGPKKLKVPNINKSHGLFECYYDESGVLMQYQVNNRGQKDAQPKQSEHQDYCTFNVPSADKYEIFAIGAGSDGYRDGNGVGYTINNSYTSSGIIHLSTFHEDIAKANVGGNELQGISSLSSEITALFEDWVNYIVQSSGGNKYLYAAFTGIKSPVGKGGSALAAKIESMDNLPNGVNCATACMQNTIECKGPYGHKLTPASDAGINKSAIAAGMCYWYVNASGGDSAKGRVMSGGVLLVPIDADPQSQFSVIRNNDRMQISSVIRGGKRFELDLKAKSDGKDAFLNTYANGTKYPAPGPDATENTPPDKVINTAGAKIGNVNLTEALLDTYFPFNEARRSRGAQYGKEEGGGLFTPGENAKPGEADFKDDAFEWSYTALGVDYEYGSAGTPGEMLSMTFNKLSGSLYIFPGKTTGNTAVDTVVSKTNSREDPKTYIIHAASRPNELTSQHEVLPLTSSIMPSPHGAIKDAATADNSAFNQYISRINESGFRGGLYNCDKSGYCPGYAGSGAYPFINLASGTNTLRIRDRQNLYNNGERSKRFDINMESNGTPKCEFGDVVTKGTKSYRDINGVQRSYEEQYCVATDDKRRDGAVVIVW